MSAVAISSGAAASAAASNAAAQAAARRAHEAECRITMPSYQDATATVEQRHEYAGCVDLMYPQEMGGGETIFVKALIALCFIGIGVGAWWGSRDTFTGAAMGAFLGAIVLPLALLVLAGLAAGAAFLFS